MPYLQKDSKTWTIGVQHAIIFEGRTACGQKGGGVFLKGECLPFLCHSWHSLVVPLS